jgi:hypothetical protein
MRQKLHQKEVEVQEEIKEGEGELHRLQEMYGIYSSGDTSNDEAPTPRAGTTMAIPTAATHTHTDTEQQWEDPPLSFLRASSSFGSAPSLLRPPSTISNPATSSNRQEQQQPPPHVVIVSPYTHTHTHSLLDTRGSSVSVSSNLSCPPLPLLEQMHTYSTQIEAKKEELHALTHAIEVRLDRLPTQMFSGVSARFRVCMLVVLVCVVVGLLVVRGVYPKVMARNKMLEFFTVFFFRGLRVYGGPSVCGWVYGWMLFMFVLTLFLLDSLT